MTRPVSETSALSAAALPQGVGLRGHLDLICAVRTGGHSYLRHQSFRAPMHISKTYEEEGTLVVNVINPNAGLLATDRVRTKVHVEAGARLLLTTPSANRVHRMDQGFAEVHQEFSVATGGWLENWPELLIPQAGARYRQTTVIQIDEGAELFFFEMLAPGRVASGEAFAYDWLEWATDLFVEHRHAARERYRLCPGGRTLEGFGGRFAVGYYASCFVITSRLASDSRCWERIRALHDREVWIGCSELASEGWIVKVLATGSILLRRTLEAVRCELFAALGERPTSLRRAGSSFSE